MIGSISQNIHKRHKKIITITRLLTQRFSIGTDPKDSVIIIWNTCQSGAFLYLPFIKLRVILEGFCPESVVFLCFNNNRSWTTTFQDDDKTTKTPTDNVGRHPYRNNDKTTKTASKKPRHGAGLTTKLSAVS